MYKNTRFKWMLIILVFLMVILSYKSIVMRNNFVQIKNQNMINNMKKKNITSRDDINDLEKYGYGDILECLSKNKDFEVKAINMMENEKCNVEVNYIGNIELLYSSLNYLNESRNFLGIISICINKDAKIANISIDFKKNK
ncbi:MAG: intein/homing endonuclease [Clostridium sp.]|jgi:intein/homing endonuclease